MKLFKRTHHLSSSLTKGRSRFDLATDLIDQSLRSSSQSELQQIAVFYLDLDRFHVVNNTYGFAFGNQILQMVQHRIKKCLRPGDQIVQLDGDEFLIIANQIRTTQDVKFLAESIKTLFQTPFILDDTHVFLSTSIGIALSSLQKQEASQLLAQADIALIAAKKGGKERFEVFHQGMHIQNKTRHLLETDLRYAIKRGEFLLHYHPIIDLRREKVVALEALIRWNHPKYGMVSPIDFIEIAEESDLIIDIGDWVLHTACKQSKYWRNAGFDNIHIAVNFSARQFHDPKIGQHIDQILNAYGITADHLEIEITESLAMKNPDFKVSILEELKHMGIRLSIDDFGTGYSSLAYLRHFPVHALKIDQSFIRNLHEKENREIVSSIIELAHKLGLEIVAEGVSSPEQIEFLKAQNCEYVQGYFYSQPLPAENVASMLETQTLLYH